MAARRKKRQAEQAPVEEVPPTWIWQFRPADWPLPDGPVRSTDGTTTVGRFTAARTAWSKAAAAWLTERGLVMWPHGGIGRVEYDRIAHEEPWRILRRPPRR